MANQTEKMRQVTMEMNPETSLAETTIPSLEPIELRDIDLPSLDQYFGLWAFEATRFLAMFSELHGIDLQSHIARHANDDRLSQESILPATENGGVAIIEINGTLMKRGTSLARSSSLLQLRRMVRGAARDQATRAILLRIDSPGGTVAGTADLAREVAEAGKRKPVWAFVEDLTASAAYWVASQAGKVFANDPTATVGSIGTFIGLYDLSGLAARESIRPIVIRSGEFKGMGFPGTEITAGQQQVLQELVDKTQGEFNRAVARGRGMSKDEVASLADGRMHMARDAVKLRLIDGIGTIDQVVRQLAKETQETGRRVALMEGTKQAATYKELVEACPGADADFLCRQLADEASITDAQKAWMLEQNKRIESTKSESQSEHAARLAAEEELKKAQNEREKTRTMFFPIRESGGETSSQGGNAIERWNAAVQKKMHDGLDKTRAISRVVKEDPELHREYLDEFNALHGRKKA